MEEEKKEKIKTWLKKPENLILLGILLISLIILLYYFNLTKSQPLWFDEAEYMSVAKHWAFDIPGGLNPQRPPLFPALASVLYIFGFTDAIIKFILVIIPAFLVILFTYLLIKEMYNPKIALVASAITSVSWIHIFYAMRFMTDALGLLFGLISFYFFWKGYVNKKSKYYLWFIGLFVVLSFLCRLTGVLYGVVIVLFLLITERFKFLKNKDLWVSLLIAVLAMVIFFIFNYLTFGNPLAFRSGYGGVPGIPLGWDMLNYVYQYTEFGFFILFILGLLMLAPMFLIFDKVILKKTEKYQNDFFMLLSFLFTLGFFIYFLRIGENRWAILMSIGIFTITARGIISIYDFVIRKSKIIAIIVLLALVLFGAYYELKHANFIIKERLPSYQEVKDAGLWMKQNSETSDVLLSLSYTQIRFYSEREVQTYAGMNETAFLDLLKTKKPRYMMISLFEPGHPDWIIQQLEQNGARIISLPYFNSSIVISGNRLSSVDLKSDITKGDITFHYVYPSNQFNGVFIYELIYTPTQQTL